jgi:hypothetical protein
MTTRQITLPMPRFRAIRAWWIRCQLDHIHRTLAHIEAQRQNDRHVERLLMGREALLRSDLRQI